uniref:Sulfurtransferase TusA n=1 Tax=Candidatus Aschnera chinzeii TaxID=1485666 RepID=A0AAT9G3W2_9ENTR|nr:MAG: sulfurtransferase TusA [Candidatus Aschnera chinzeii]
MCDIFINYTETIDIQGLRCPETMMMIRKMIRQMHKNDILLIITDDSSVYRDIYAFCTFMNHKLIAKNLHQIPYKFLIKKRD